MVREIDPDNEEHVRNFVMDFRRMILESKGRGIVLDVDIQERKEELVRVRRLKAPLLPVEIP